MAAEDDHHALVDCTVARALRFEMRSVWSLPTEMTFDTNGKEWLLHLLSKSPKDMRPKILFLLWRAWHHRNNIVHGDGKASVSASVSFLANYLDSFSAIKSQRTCDNGTSWIPPEPGALKANVDAGWNAHSRDAGIGVVVRDHQGKVILSEWKFSPNCGSAEEAEVLACLAGLKHLIGLRQWPAILESDCLRAIQALSLDSPESSSSWALILEGRELLRIYQDIRVAKVDRVNNSVAHVLAQFSKAGFSGLLSFDAPDCVRELVSSEMM
jgi:ribonuclease HI